MWRNITICNVLMLFSFYTFILLSKNIICNFQQESQSYLLISKKRKKKYSTFRMRNIIITRKKWIMVSRICTLFSKYIYALIITWTAWFSWYFLLLGVDPIYSASIYVLYFFHEYFQTNNTSMIAFRHMRKIFTKRNYYYRGINTEPSLSKLRSC